LADEEDHDEEAYGDLYSDYVPYEVESDSSRSGEDTPWYFKASTLPFGILALFFALGWMMLVYLNHLPSYLDVFSVLLFFFGWMGVPLILGWWHER
jgi:hypothetical protein